MPRIPTYEKNVRVQVPTVRNVPVNQPLREAMMDPSDLNFISNVSAGFGLYAAAPDIADKFLSTVKMFLPKKKEKKEPVDKPLPPVPGPQTGRGGELPQPDQADPSAALFSSPQRAELFEYASSKLAVEPAAESVNQPGGAEMKTPSARLEKFMDKTLLERASLQPALQPSSSVNPLLEQDYAVLQSDLTQASWKQQRAAAKDAFDQAGERFVQTAALIKTPQALREYISSNVSAAQAEGPRLGLDQKAAAARVQRLQSAAVTRSIELSLASGEWEAAEQVLESFSDDLPPANRAMLRRRLKSGAEQALGESLFAEAKERFSSGPGRWEKEKADEFINSRLSSQDEQTRRGVREYVGLERAREERALARMQSIWHREIAQEALSGAGNAESYASWSRRLLSGRCLDDEDFTRKHHALRQLYARSQQPSDPAEFNRLFEQASLPEFNEKSIDKAFARSSLNAQDYFTLKAHYFENQSGPASPENALLCSALRRLCDRNGVEGDAAQQVAYAVLSYPGGAAEKIACAKAVKELLTL